MKITISQEGCNPIIIKSTESANDVDFNIKSEVEKKVNEFLKYIKTDDDKINKFISNKTKASEIIRQTLHIMYKYLKSDPYYEWFLEDNNLHTIKDFYSIDKKKAFTMLLKSINFNTKNNQITKPKDYWNDNIRLKHKTVANLAIPRCWFAIPFGYSPDPEHGRGIRISMKGNVVDYGDQAKMCWY